MKDCSSGLFQKTQLHHTARTFLLYFILFIGFIIATKLNPVKFNEHRQFFKLKYCKSGDYDETRYDTECVNL